MTNREKVIKGLQCIIDGTVRCASCGYAINKQGHYSCQQECAKDAIILLKEQETVKPSTAADTWICPKCGHTLESQHLIDDKDSPRVLVHDRYNFCPNCGRVVKWHS